MAKLTIKGKHAVRVGITHTVTASDCEARRAQIQDNGDVLEMKRQAT